MTQTPSPLSDSEELIQQRIDKAIAESKKGNSEDDIAQLLWLVQGIDIWHQTNGQRGHSLEDAMQYLASAIVRRDVERDQQQAAKILAALPEKQDEHPIDPETGKAVETYGYEELHNQVIDQCTEAITAVLGGKS